MYEAKQQFYLLSCKQYRKNSKKSKIFTDGEWKETNKKLGKLFGNMK